MINFDDVTNENIKEHNINPIQNGGAKKPSLYQFFPCNFYKRRIWSPKRSDFQF